mgnify:CR=1 FL=1
MNNPNRSKKDQIAIEELRKIVNFYNPMMFKVGMYKYILDPELVIIDSYLCICHEKTTKDQKTAAYELLKNLVCKNVLDTWLEGSAVVCDREDRLVRKWKKEVIKPGKCAICGETEHLEAHHIIPWAIYPKGRVDIKNGICLCDKCHAEQHKGEIEYAMMKYNIRKRRGAASG